MTAVLPERRVERRQPVQGGRRWRWVATALLAAAAVAVLTWVIAFSSILGAANVRVRGTHTLTADRVRAAADIVSGSPLARLDTGAIERRIEGLPDVASARVVVSYPSTVLITVRERVAVGYLELARGAVLVDVTGRQFRSVATPPRGLPRFDVPAGVPGEAPARAVAVVAGALPATVRAALASIQASDPSAVTLNLSDRRVVRWGSVERSDTKGAVLVALLGRPGSVFDVSDPDLAVVR